MARTRKPNKTKKTALKRLRKTNPKGNRKAKLLYNESSQGHLKTKKSTRAKRRKSRRTVVDVSIQKRYKKTLSI